MIPHALAVTIVAVLIEAAVGYPDWIFRRIGHPVTWMGSLLAALERRLNLPDDSFRRRKTWGVVALAILLVLTAAITVPLQWITPDPLGCAIVAVVAASLPAQRSLFVHVRDVADALDIGLDQGRAAVSRIVGRNTATLDEAGVGRAAIESLAENFSDGVVAPVVYLALFGLPGGALCKAINTADSMIGHRNARYEAFGWAAARLDDGMNLPASRVSALFIVLAAWFRGADWRAAIRAVRRDASRHRSPNAGWPEAAMAGALGIGIGGPRIYGESLAQEPYMGDGRTEITAQDIRKALGLYRTACAIQCVALVILLIVFG